MLTVGVDLASQPRTTGLVVLRWDGAGGGAEVVHAATGADDAEVLRWCAAAADSGGRVGVDCPLGWPRAFRAFVDAHARGAPLPAADPAGGTRELRLRATDVAVHTATGITPLSVSTDRLGVTAFRAARLLAALAEDGHAVGRAGDGLVAEVYPRATRAVWGLARRERSLAELLGRLPLTVGEDVAQRLADEHAFDALVAALAARAVALGLTDGPPAELAGLAAEEGWVRLPRRGTGLPHLDSNQEPAELGAP